MAPDVLRGLYEGDEADLWSAAVVLFVMLRGCHPWEEASTRCMHYKKFSLLREHNSAPWIGLDEDCRDLLGRMLINDPQGRLKTWKDLWRHPWIAQENPLFDERFLW